MPGSGGASWEHLGEEGNASPRDPYICWGLLGRRVSGLPHGACEEVQPGTYPSPTTTHLMACMVSGVGSGGNSSHRGKECFCGRQGCGEPGKAPRQEAEEQRDRRQEEAEGELTQAAAPRAVCRRRSMRSTRTASAPQVLGQGTSKRPEDSLGRRLASMSPEDVP